MTLTAHDAAYLERLRAATREVLRDALGPGPHDIVYLNVPRHRNLGDSLLWMGALQHLDRLGHRIVRQSDQGRYRDGDLRKVSSQAVIVFHGGGSLGDLYPPEDEFRRHVIRRHPARRFVLLPQTLYYSSAETERVAMSEYRAARDLTVLLRDERSVDAARRAGLAARFCHDVAFGADLQAPRSEARSGVLVVARSDHEAASTDTAGDAPCDDWTFSAANRVAWQAALAVGRVYKRLPPTGMALLGPGEQGANRALLRLNIRAVEALFARPAAVATNRLHAHIAAALFGIPHAVADNSYGKVSTIFREYSGRFSTARLAGSLSEAVRMAGALTSGWD